MYPRGEANPNIHHKILSINITEQCNLRCVYCYQVERRSRKKTLISFEAATAFIADHLSRDDQFTQVIIDLIGGEVLLYKDFTKRLIEWILQNRGSWKKHVQVFIDTNGTLLTAELKQWLFDRRDHVIAGLSLDGTPAAHDLNRSHSYDRIAPHIPFFASTWPHQPVKMTISPSTIPMIFESVLHVMGEGFLVAANVPMEDIWGTPNEKACHVEAFRREIVKLVEYFCTNVSAPLPSLIDIPIWLILSKDRDRPWCGSGKNMVAIDVSGRELPCTRYASMSFDQSLFDKPIAPDVSRCRRCWFKPACETCEALNWETNGNPDSRTSFHCEFIKWQAWGTAQAHSLRLQKRFEDIKASAVVEPEARAAELAEIGAHLEAVAFVLDQFEQHANLDDVGMMPVGQEAPESSF